MKTIISIIVVVLLAWFAWSLWGTPADSSPETNSENTSEEMMEDNETMMEEESVKTFDISGKNFEFSVKEIRVKKGETVKINFVSESGFHDWKLDEFETATKQLQEGESDSVEFIADETGEFEYYCSVGSHRELGMVGKLIVE